MEKPNVQLMYAAVRDGHVSDALRLLEDNPEIRGFPGFGGGWLSYAARAGQLSMVEALIAAGFDINRGWPVETPLDDAVRSGNVGMARWLLDHGARLRQTERDEGGGMIVGAANMGSLELVKLLVERGADPNLSYGIPPRNALSHAIVYGHTEIADYLRSLGVEEPPFEAPKHGGGLHDEILSFMEHKYGEISGLALSEIVPVSFPPMSLHVSVPKYSWCEKVLFTVGMSDEPMEVPPELGDYRLAELALALPSEWPLDLQSLRNPEHSWPVDWIRRIAGYPFENGTSFGGAAAIISNGEPAEPFALSTRFVAWLVFTTSNNQLVAEDGRIVNLYKLFPLYPEERDMGLAHGPLHLIKQLHQNGLDNVIDLNRKNVATGQ